MPAEKVMCPICFEVQRNKKALAGHGNKHRRLAEPVSKETVDIKLTIVILVLQEDTHGN